MDTIPATFSTETEDSEQTDEDTDWASLEEDVEPCDTDDRGSDEKETFMR